MPPTSQSQERNREAIAMDFLKSYWTQGTAFAGGLIFEVYFQAADKVLGVIQVLLA